MTKKAMLDRFLLAQDRLVFQGADLSLGTIAQMVAGEAIDVSPSYQRRERWSVVKQSALIESFLLNVPVPPVYLAEDEFGKYSVVDGKQRITSIARFLENELVLTNLESFHEIDGKRFADLPEEMQNALQVRPYLRVITLLKQSDPLLKFEVFTRLNKGGEAMAAQELRNVAFRGPLNDLIYELSENDFLKRALKIKDAKSSAYRNMVDAELVLRFFTMQSRWRRFSGDYRLEMDEFMIEHRDAWPLQLNIFEADFSRTIGGVRNIWGSNAFKRPSGDGWRDLLLTGMYDAQMVAVSLLTENQITAAIANKRRVVTRTRELFDDPIFETAVRIGTNTPGRVAYRIQCVYRVLDEVADV